MAKRFIKEPSIAISLFSIGRGIIKRTSMTPKIRPAIIPDSNLFIFLALLNKLSENI